jgi:regulator of sigma E protease
MNIAIIIITFIVILFIVVSFHELGHFITAKRTGVKVEEFGIGLPPRLFGIKRGETIYSLNAIPLGAFVKTPGEDDPTVPRSLASKGPWSRLAIYAAGPLANIFLAFILLSVFFGLPTNVITGNGVMVHSVVEDSAAQAVDIRPGDIILELNGEPIHKWGDIQSIINSCEEDGEITLLLQRDGSQVQKSLEPMLDPETQRQIIGILLCWNIVNEVEQSSPAYEAGIRPGDTILSINRQAIYSDESVSNALNSTGAGEGIHLVLFTGEEEVVEKDLDSGQEIEGMELRWVDRAHIEQEQLPPWKAAYLSGDYIIHMPKLIADAIPLIKEEPGLALVGPIGAGQLTIEAIRVSGFSYILFMASAINLGLALFNFIPVPPLDGGGMLVALIEGARRGKRLSPRAVHLTYTIGTALLIALVVLITLNDILRIIRGGGFGL